MERPALEANFQAALRRNAGNVLKKCFLPARESVPEI